MPRTKLAEKVRPAAYIAANIEYYASYYNYTRERLATIAHCQRQTFRSRMKDPETFKIGELERLARSFNVSIIDLLEKRQ